MALPSPLPAVRCVLMDFYRYVTAVHILPLFLSLSLFFFLFLDFGFFVVKIRMYFSLLAPPTSL